MYVHIRIQYANLICKSTYVRMCVQLVAKQSLQQSY